MKEYNTSNFTLYYTLTEQYLVNMLIEQLHKNIKYFKEDLRWNELWLLAVMVVEKLHFQNN